MMGTMVLVLRFLQLDELLKQTPQEFIHIVTQTARRIGVIRVTTPSGLFCILANGLGDILIALKMQTQLHAVNTWAACPVSPMIWDRTPAILTASS